MELGILDKKLRISLVAFFAYIFFDLLAGLNYAISSLIGGYFDPPEFIDLFSFDTFIKVFGLFLLTLSLAKKNFNSVPEREIYLARFLLTLFFLYYVCNFYFINRLANLETIGISSLPNSISDFLPIDWFAISTYYQDIFGAGYVSDYGIIGLFSSVLSALCFLLAVYAGTAYVKTNPQIKVARPRLRILFEEIKSFKMKAIIAAIIFPFCLLSIENIKGDDFEIFAMEAQFIQDDLKNYQTELISANKIVLSFERTEARKVASNKAYGEIVGKYDRIESFGLSLWSENQKEIKSELLEWIKLWESLLKQISLTGTGEASIIFDLNQKYVELAKLAESRAPSFVRDYYLDFWNEEFIALVSSE